MDCNSLLRENIFLFFLDMLLNLICFSSKWQRMEQTYGPGLLACSGYCCLFIIASVIVLSLIPLYLPYKAVNVSGIDTSMFYLIFVRVCFVFDSLFFRHRFVISPIRNWCNKPIFVNCHRYTNFGNRCRMPSIFIFFLIHLCFFSWCKHSIWNDLP
jgi:acid stress-induced BolA-like protein IbaG/YrbA